jgi:hypothetical protein
MRFTELRNERVDVGEGVGLSQQKDTINHHLSADDATPMGMEWRL